MAFLRPSTKIGAKHGSSKCGFCTCNLKITKLAIVAHAAECAIMDFVPEMFLPDRFFLAHCAKNILFCPNRFVRAEHSCHILMLHSINFFVS
jgi:hypothetical protein